MFSVNDWEAHVAARLLDFFGTNTPWHRSLWNPGLVLMLKEILEASEAIRDSSLSDDAMRIAVESVKRAAPLDNGIGNRKYLKALQQSLDSKLRFDGLDYLALKELTHQIEEHYLSEWASAIASDSLALNPERVARSIAAHLLDLGFSASHLHRWWTYRLRYEVPKRRLSDLVIEAHTFALSKEQEYEVLITFAIPIPKTKSGLPPEWLEARAVSKWLLASGFDTKEFRQGGGLLIRLKARDSQAATEAASEVVEKISDRSDLAAMGAVRPIPRAWVKGEKSPIDIRQHRRGARVRALYREDAVYQRATIPSVVDAAFELIAAMQTGSMIAAIAGGWAAIEALLGEPNDRGGAADRLAALIACSLPRAELTALSYILEKEDAQMRTSLASIRKNRDRAAAVASAISSGQSFSLMDWSDRAAVSRIANILARPTEVLADIQRHVADSLRRLYRQRNLLLHAGKTNAIALGACLRTASPLVGAGMDRITHAWYVNNMAPLEVAARARTAITTAIGGSATCCVDLLEGIIRC